MGGARGSRRIGSEGPARATAGVSVAERRERYAILLPARLLQPPNEHRLHVTPLGGREASGGEDSVSIGKWPIETGADMPEAKQTELRHTLFESHEEMVRPRSVL